jgi:hypothetical protein
MSAIRKQMKAEDLLDHAMVQKIQLPDFIDAVNGKCQLQSRTAITNSMRALEIHRGRSSGGSP